VSTPPNWGIEILGDGLSADHPHEREAKGLSLRDMAKKIKVSPTFLSKVETEDWKPGEEKRAMRKSW
jgi:hypothetical protein